MRDVESNKQTVSPYLVFFLLYVSMVEAGIWNFQKALVQYAGYNAWLSIPITGLSIHLIIWMMYHICSSNEGMSVYEINQRYFGRWFGRALNTFIICYFAYGAFITFRAYLAIIQYMLFPEMNLLPICLIFVVLLYYTVSGGFRTVAGISFWGVLLSTGLVIPLNLLHTSYLHPQNLFPLWDHSVLDILLSAKSMVIQYLGIEAFLVYYPFIGTPGKSKKWAHFAILIVTSYYLITILITFMYYSEPQLNKVIWPTLHRVALLKLPLVQRLEYFVISVLLIKIVASIALGLWSACRGAKLSLRIKQPVSLILILALFVIAAIVVKDKIVIKTIFDFYATVGFYLIYAYIPLLFVISRLRRRKEAPRFQ